MVRKQVMITYEKEVGYFKIFSLKYKINIVLLNINPLVT